MSDEYQSRFEPLIETRVRIATWNIWWQFGPWEERYPAIETTLVGLDADIICLQEVWGQDGISSASKLADRLGYHVYFDSDLELNGVEFGNAILSRWPIVDTESRVLTAEGASQEHRIALRANVDGPRGEIQVFTTHLNWMLQHSGIRQTQVAELAQFVAEGRPRHFPAVVCGDFNADPHSDEIHMMTGRTAVPVDNIVFFDAWETGGDGSMGATWDHANPYAAAELEPHRRIDYIFTGWPRDGGAGHVTSCRVAGNQTVDGVWPSDHCAVVAELRY